MRTTILNLIALAMLVATPAVPGQAAEPGIWGAPAATDFSAAKRRHRPSVRASSPYRHGPGTIACTHAGCVPVPPGCHAIRERTIDGSPSGFQIIVC